MGAKKNVTLEKVVKLIQDDPNIVFVNDICEAFPIASSTFYEHFPSSSEEYKKIDQELDNNKSKKKKQIRDRLLDSGNAAALIFLYKIMTKDFKERAALDGRYIPEDEKKDNNKEIELKID